MHSRCVFSPGASRWHGSAWGEPGGSDPAGSGLPIPQTFPGPSVYVNVRCLDDPFPCSICVWGLSLFKICSSKISLACESHAAYHHWLYYIYIYLYVYYIYMWCMYIYNISHKCVFSDGKRYVGICRNHEPTELHANLRPCDTQIEYSSHLWPNYVPKAGKSSIYEHL